MAKQLVINDANILIDLIKLDLINAFFQLNKFELITTDFVYNELYENQQKDLSVFIQDSRLTIIPSSIDDLMEISKIKHSTNGLTIEDCSVFYFASRLKGALLTGDNRLRKFSTEHGVEVHGIIYVFEELIISKVIAFSEAIEKMENLLSFNSHLPRKEIAIRIEKWKNGEV